jgi:fatty acid desaturase
MAKGKRRKSTGSGEAQQRREGDSSPKSMPQQRPAEDRFTFAEYLVAVLVFWVFCGLTFLATWLWTKETIGMPFFFLALCVGFTVVAVFSWLHDIFYREDETEEEPAA